MLGEIGLSLSLKSPAQPPSGSKLKKIWQRFFAALVFLLTALALVELLPRISASAVPPFDANHPLASRWTVTNEGYLKITRTRAICFVWRVQAVVTMQNSASNPSKPTGNVLSPGDSFTVPCSIPGMLSGPYHSADIAIIVFYHPWPFTFFHYRRFFRFVMRRETDGNITWDKQPTPPELELDFDRLKQIDPEPWMFN